jgi:hypothetical protein
MGNASSSLKPMQPAPESSSPEQKQLMFVPSSSDSKPIDFIGIERTWDMMSTSTKNYLDVYSLKTLASEKNSNRATSEFIADAIGNDSDTCLWLNAKVSPKGHAIPKGISIHLFANANAKKIFTHEVRSMIIQVSEPCDSYLVSCEFLEFLFSKVSFTNLKCLMLYGIPLSDKFSQWIEALNVESFYMAKFGFDTGTTQCMALRPCNTLKRLYMVHPDGDMMFYPPDELERLVIYCPESSEGVINVAKTRSDGLNIRPSERHTMKEM